MIPTRGSPITASTVKSSSRSPQAAVFYSTVRNWGWGAPDYVWPIAAAELAQRGVPVVAVCRPQILDRPQIRALAEQGVQLFRQPPLVYRRGRLSDLKSIWLRYASSTRALRRALRHALRPHYFIEQSGSYDFLDEPLLLDFIESTGATYDVVFRSNQPKPPMAAEDRRCATLFLEAASRTLFNSRWTREITELQLLHRFTNAAYIQHLVRFPHESPLPWPADNTLRLASVSRLDCHHKGLDALLQSLALLPSTLSPWTLDLYGHGPDESYLRQLATVLRLDDRVRFHSATDDIRGLWTRCHLLLLVSRYEGLAVSMLEAMACGRPVLRTPYGGCAEWIVPNETGFVCPAAEPSLIAQSLAEAMQSSSRWPEMGRAAHARIRRQLTLSPESIFLDPFEHGTPSAGKP